ncbi:MAG TPA: hypothetical protein DCF63_06975, partial [Planctomycetaceae bacterium]|nr:hypothetical protein [Planctomycetaceae bacterium]
MKNRIGSAIQRDKVYSRSRASRLRSLRLEALEGRQLLTVSPAPVHNALIAEDTNLDFRVSALDALMVVNHLNARSAGGEGELATFSQSSNSYLDVNNDGRVTALDALQVINRLNGEGESATLMRYSYSITNVIEPSNALAGSPITQVAVGQTFQVNVFVQDVRDPFPPAPGGGVLGAAIDIGINSLAFADYQHPVGAFEDGYLLNTSYF